MTAYAMPKVGDLVAGKYRLEKVAGEGGMGIVYAAEHLVLRQRVAVKVLLPDAAQSDAVVERFSREAQAAARIQSEHVARVMDAGSLASGAPFLVMEYLEGCDLEELLDLQGTLPMEEVVDYLLQALEALAHAHAVGIVHRDLKPANLFLACRPDGGNVVKIVDFGISKSVAARPDEKKLTGQAVLGSPVYMSPEQLRNAKEIDGRADLWSLGVVAYELLTGGPPFDGDGVGEIFAAILEKEAEPIHTKNWRVPGEFSDVIAKCLQRNPDDRYADTAAMARALVPYGTGQRDGVVDRIEQVLARAKVLSVGTPLETRRVVDAIAAAAERARTTGAGTFPALLLTTKKAPSDDAQFSDQDDARDARDTDTRDTTASEALSTQHEGRARKRWIGVAVAAVVVVSGAVAGAMGLRASHASTEEAPPVAVNVVQVRPSGAPQAGASAAASGSDENGAPVVMDLPDNSGQAGTTAQRSQTAKPGKPERPNFLKTRE